MPLDSKTLYWTAAWINMAMILALGGMGIRQAASARYASHRRWMLSACGLVGLFVLSYGIKLALLGREALEIWEPRYVYVLRLHELCVLVMVIGGAIALRHAYRLELPVDIATGPMRATPELARGVRLHRRAGLVALIAATLGVATAAYVLQGMYARL